MNQKTKLVMCGLSLSVLTACGGAGDSPDIGAAMSAIGGPIPAPANVDSTQTPDPLANIEVEDTKSLMVADDFAFDTAQSINVDFDIESARGTDGSVSICTEYQTDDSGFDIDYDSCTVRGNMTDGVFSHRMDVTNEFTSVVAVVWFQDETLEPFYKEFSVGSSSSDRSTKSVDGKKVIVWR